MIVKQKYSGYFIRHFYLVINISRNSVTMLTETECLLVFNMVFEICVVVVAAV